MTPGVITGRPAAELTFQIREAAAHIQRGRSAIDLFARATTDAECSALIGEADELASALQDKLHAISRRLRSIDDRP